MDKELLRHLYVLAKFNELLGRAFDEHFFADDLKEAKKVKLKDR